jgi:hypothetical protein
MVHCKYQVIEVIWGLDFDRSKARGEACIPTTPPTVSRSPGLVDYQRTG